MMEMCDAAEALEAMYKHERDMQTLSESKGYDNIAGQSREKAEALRTAIAVLKGLDANKAKAENVVRAMRICNDLESVEDCQKCPYYDGCKNYGSQLDKDTMDLLTLAYLQGGDGDDQR